MTISPNKFVLAIEAFSKWGAIWFLANILIYSNYFRDPLLNRYLPIYILVTAITTLFFLVPFISQIKRSFKNEYFRIDEYGIVDNLSPYKLGKIEWENISYAKVDKTRMGSFLIIKFNSTYKDLVGMSIFSKLISGHWFPTLTSNSIEVPLGAISLSRFKIHEYMKLMKNR